MYHEVVADRPQEAHAVSVAQFKAQMQWLHENGYTVVALSQMLAARSRGARLPRRAVAITFDDGYRDNHEQAWPVLQAHAYTATIFLVSGLMSQTSQWRAGSLGQAPLLSWAQAREMAAQGVSFGSHTVTHPDLATLSAGQAEHELRASRADIEAHLGRPVHLLAYPYSRFTPQVKQSLPDYGYQLACACPTGYVGATDRDLLELKRITLLAEDTLEDFGRKVRGSLRRRLAWYRRVAGGWYHRWLSPNRTG